MTADELRGLRAYPRHFELDGLPVCVQTSASLPRAYTGSGTWETFPAIDRLLVQGQLVTIKRFNALCRHIDRLIEQGVPFIESAEA